MMEILFWNDELCIHCTSVLLSSAQMCRSSSMRVHHDCGYHAAGDAHCSEFFISDTIRLRMSASPRVQQKKTKSKQYQTLKAFQPTSMKAWEAIVTTPLNFLECSFSVDGIAVIFRGGEDENSQNNRNAANCVLLTACTASYDSRYAASVVDILQHPSDLPTCIRSSNSRRSHKLRTSHTQDDDASPLLERGIVHPLHLGSALFGADVPLFKHACPSRLWIPCSSS